ncbi:Mg2+ and Co2+ transport protein [Secundilactobacillus oryzae JCM 18671]|uniref:Mg2+ and Co2+ transport protein n=1 Tax=Secundilactobacillus oryzae JCM 18671 TaxID=1291743 RepID=A0A081BHX1_9LACO|nr:magnesium transporter CorA family protein [Secundilactobacillus oryzae]GAK47639.1 Mg2+ and Co2+ transport protein [Secundilactobacillus oryzae JCM 18671]
MVEVVKINDDFSWIKVENLTDSDRNELQSNYQIPKRFLRYVSDVHERARFDTDEDSNATLVIFDVVVSQHFDGMDNTEPVAFLITPDTFISFTRPKSSFINHSIKELIDHHLTKKKPIRPFFLLTRLLFQLSLEYFDILDDVNVARTDIQVHLMNQKSHKAITQLMNLETSLVFLLTSLTSNHELLNDMERTMTLSQEEHQALDNVLIEAKQGQEMAQMASDIIDRVSNAYSNLLDSNLNNTMKFLTVYSIILMIPPIVFGFYGQNVPIPWQHSPLAWILTIVVSAILIGILVRYFHKNNLL